MGILSLFTSCFIGKSRKVENPESVQPVKSIYDITIPSLNEKSTIRFSDFRGKYIVIVNTASECGYTPQYTDLQAFYESIKDRNIVLIGCPCNQFGGQEPGNASEIEDFCKSKFGVTFPLTKKIDVKGTDQHPLYQWLTMKSYNGAGDFEVKWNFNKFIVNPEGKLTNYFSSAVTPDDPEFRKALGL